MSILGNRVLRTEDPKFLTVGGGYVADLDDPQLAGALHVVYVRSVMAHATFGELDLEEARSAPGVVAVFSAADVPIAPLAPNPPMMPMSMSRPLLATGKVRFVGEPVVAIVAETLRQAADAAELVWPDYEPLDAVVDFRGAADNPVLLFEEAGTNLCLDLNFGVDEALFEGCDVVVSGEMINQRLAGAPLEVRSAAAAWDGTKLTQWASTQAPHAVRDAIAASLGLDAEHVRVIAPDVGGGFGPKIGAYPEELLVGWIAKELGRPVRWTETRTENMLAMGHGRAQHHRFTIGGSRDGRVNAYRLEVLQDGGAYPSLGAFLPYLTRMMASGVYDIPKVECNGKSVVTNTISTVAYRGAGRPEATAAIERAMDLFAAELGMDPVEVRRRNLVSPDQFPYTTATGTTYDVGDYERSLDFALVGAAYADLRDQQQQRRDAGDVKQLGIGVSIYVEVTAGPTAGAEYGKVIIEDDGTVTVHSGASSHGQGHRTAFAMIVADELGVPLEKVNVIESDTDIVARGVGTFGSRSLQLGGSAVLTASQAVLARAKELAADLLEAAPADIELDKVEGRFHVAGTPAVAKTWAEVRSAAGADGLAEDVDFTAPGPTFPYGAHVAVVEVDTETGEVELIKMVTCDDAGRVLNPVLAEGQRHGGIAQGVAQALYEQITYDADGNPQTANFADYSIVSAPELPSFFLITTETPTPVNPLGAKGIGESGTIGSTPAVQSAVCDALGHLGIRHVDMPCTPERVWAAIQSSR